MDKGTKNYRDMMKRMEKDDPSIVNPARPSGMMGGTPAVFDMMKTLDPKSVVRENEVMELPDGNMVTKEGKRIFDDMGNIRDDAMSGLTMADREAIEALTTMGISLEDAMEAVMGTVPESMVEGAVGATMGGGALQALPMERPAMRDDMRADRTQSMDMQKTGMGT